MINLEEVKNLFKERLTAARESNKLTKSEVARRLGIAHASYAQYEEGKNLPGWENLFLLSEKLEVTVSYLLALDIFEAFNLTPLSISVNNTSNGRQNPININDDSIIHLPFLPVSDRVGIAKYPNFENYMKEKAKTLPVVRTQLPYYYHDCVIIEVSNDHMEPKYQNKDRVLAKEIEKENYQGVPNGRTVVVITSNKDFTLKKLVLNKQDTLILTSLNPMGPQSIEVPYETIKTMYLVERLIDRED